MFEENIKNNLKKIKFIFLSLLIGAFFLQIFLINDYLNIYSLIFLVLSNLLIYFYCLNPINVINYPISTFSLVFTNLYTNCSAIFFKSFYLKSIDENLYDSNFTFLFLLLVNIALIILHIFYKKIKLFKNLKKKFTQILYFFSFKNENDKERLIYIGLASLIFSTISITFFGDTIYKKEIYGPNLVGDIINGIKVFYMAPFIVLFTIKYYNYKLNKKDLFLIFLCFIFVIYLSLGLNSRSAFFDILFNAILIYSFLIFTGIIKIEVLKLNKVLAMILISIFLGNNIEKFSQTYIDVRGERDTTNPINNIKNHLKTFGSKNNKNKFIHISKEIFNENYHSINIINRLNVVKATDNVIFAKKYLNQNQIEDLLNYEKGKIISIFPNPIIKIFSSNFNKGEYLEFTLTSKIYMTVDKLFRSGKNNGVVFSIIYFYQNFLFLFVFIILILITFSFLDSFKKNNDYHVLLFILMYATSGSMINILTSGSIADLLTTLLRVIPQAIIIFSLYNYLYGKILSR